MIIRTRSSKLVQLVTCISVTQRVGHLVEFQSAAEIIYQIHLLCCHHQYGVASNIP